jgi:hypothetical protein
MEILHFFFKGMKQRRRLRQQPLPFNCSPDPDPVEHVVEEQTCNTLKFHH